MLYWPDEEEILGRAGKPGRHDHDIGAQTLPRTIDRLRQRSGEQADAHEDPGQDEYRQKERGAPQDISPQVLNSQHEEAHAITPVP